MNIKQAIAGTAIFAALALNVTPVLAQSPNPSGRPNLPRPSFSPRPTPNGERIAERCVEVRKHLDKRLEKFGENKQTFINNAEHLHDRLVKLVEKAESLGLDTTQVREDLRSLESKVDKLAEDHRVFVEKLQTAKAVDCAQNPDQFRTALKEANAQLKALRSDWRDIKDFFKNTIKPDFKALKDQLPSPSASPSPSPTATE